MDEAALNVKNKIRTEFEAIESDICAKQRIEIRMPSADARTRGQPPLPGWLWISS